jgi:hypothetical protein
MKPSTAGDYYLYKYSLDNVFSTPMRMHSKDYHKDL